MTFFQRAYRGILGFFASSSAVAVEKEILEASVPVVEVAVGTLAKTNPTVGVVVSILTPVLNTEITKLENHKSG